MHGCHACTACMPHESQGPLRLDTDAGRRNAGRSLEAQLSVRGYGRACCLELDGMHVTRTVTDNATNCSLEPWAGTTTPSLTCVQLPPCVATCMSPFLLISCMWPQPRHIRS